MTDFSNVSLPGDSSAPYREITQGIGMIDYGGANVDHANVLFYRKSVPDPALSAQYGRPMEKSVEYVRIQQPMTRDSTDNPLANAMWAIQRYPKQWAQYQKSIEQVPDGSPVSVLFPQNPEMVANLRQYGVHVVEQLAGALDADLQNIPIGGTQMRDRARKYLEIANKGVAYHQLQQALSERDNKIEVLTNQLNQMRGEIDRLSAERRGVPQAMIPTAPLPYAPQTVHVQPQTVYVPPQSVSPAPPMAPLPVRAWTPPALPAAPPWAPEAADAPIEPQGVSGPSIDPPQVQPPAKRGWPKGKPRKTATPA